MAQHDYVLDNAVGSTFRSDLNSALSAVVSINSGTSAPSTTFANMLWYDTTNNVLKMRNEDNDAWISIFSLDQTNDRMDVVYHGAGSASLPTMSFSNDVNTGFYNPSSDAIGVALGGVLQANFSSTASAVNYLNLTGAATGNGPVLSADGSDSNVAMNIVSKGNGQINFKSDSGTITNFNIARTASADSYLGVISSVVASANPSLLAASSSSNCGMNIVSKGNGSITFKSAGGSTTLLDINGTAGSLTSLQTYNNTTASAANVNVSSGGVLARSTSSELFKKDIETMDYGRAEALLELRPIWYKSTCDLDNKDWSWYGFTAEQVAEIDPRFVQWGYLPEDYEDVEIANPYFGMDGQPEKIKEKKLKQNAKLRPMGVAYERMVVPLLALVKNLNDRLKVLEQ